MQYKIENHKEIREYLNIYNCDNMELLRQTPDNYYSLAIVDPPYGININNNMGRRKGDKHSGHKKVKWDNEIPSESYFNELFRVSKNQIIWGGNYFPLPLTGSWIFWDKKMPPEMSFSAGELAWMTFGNTLRKVVIQQHGYLNKEGKKIHPTQKPVALYQWLLKNYAKQGDKILDTHLGSMSIAIAIDSVNKIEGMNLTLTGCELDPEYYAKGLERVENETKWESVFKENPINEVEQIKMF